MSGKVTSMGGARDFERLQAVYDKLDQSALGERPDIPKLRQATGDPDLDAKLIVQDLMQFFLLMCMERSASPATMLYAAELFALNVTNAEDCPLPPAQRNAARKRAYDYYVSSLPKVPSAPKR